MDEAELKCYNEKNEEKCKEMKNDYCEWGENPDSNTGKKECFYNPWIETISRPRKIKKPKDSDIIVILIKFMIFIFFIYIILYLLSPGDNIETIHSNLQRTLSDTANEFTDKLKTLTKIKTI